jgi:hypothetical protein
MSSIQIVVREGMTKYIGDRKIFAKHFLNDMELPKADNSGHFKS